MNIQEQMELYKTSLTNRQIIIIDNVTDAERVIEALEKQIPKKPITVPYPDSDKYAYECPCKCRKFGGYVMVSRWQNYCDNCGQAIDWSEVE